jgi:O-antigen ligase
VATQVAAVASLNGAVALAIGVSLCAAYYWKTRHLRRPLVGAVLLSLSVSVVYALALDTTHNWFILHASQAARHEQWQFFINAIIKTPQILVIGSGDPLDRNLHPSAYNYWLDIIYRLGVLPLIPLLILLVLVARKAWQQRLSILKSPLCIGTTLIIFNLFFIESMFGAGLRQPYPGLISFFILGLLITQLKTGLIEKKEGSPVV